MTQNQHNEFDSNGRTGLDLKIYRVHVACAETLAGQTWEVGEVNLKWCLWISPFSALPGLWVFFFFFFCTHPGFSYTY